MSAITILLFALNAVATTNLRSETLGFDAPTLGERFYAPGWRVSGERASREVRAFGLDGLASALVCSDVTVAAQFSVSRDTDFEVGADGLPAPETSAQRRQILEGLDVLGWQRLSTELETRGAFNSTLGGQIRRIPPHTYAHTQLSRDGEIVHLRTWCNYSLSLDGYHCRTELTTMPVQVKWSCSGEQERPSRLYEVWERRAL